MRDKGVAGFVIYVWKSMCICCKCGSQPSSLHSVGFLPERRWSTAAYIPTVDSLLRLRQHVSGCDEFLLMLFVSELLSTVDCTVASSMRLWFKAKQKEELCAQRDRCSASSYCSYCRRWFHTLVNKTEKLEVEKRKTSGCCVQQQLQINQQQSARRAGFLWEMFNMAGLTSSGLL